ncbi:hypothetical protein Dda_9002 [Drechslerella dactyloides]|uniref:F-box domain-containing protein n=1 Tax=Drechslerella dactyloides TaxID=74499 RepID=A0AAD6ITJ9_DREDA|nr:hypothetical protein Dda_9002 [Drechslerella dactyloides]
MLVYRYDIMSFAQLPTELLAQVLENVRGTGTRYSCLLVNRRFHAIMQPLLYRDLRIPFLSENRLVTLVRAVRRFPHMASHTRSLTMGADPYDPRRTTERLVGREDLSRLFPTLRKVQLYGMTFERSMMILFLGYCSRMPALEELEVQYPDLVPLQRQLPLLKKLTWSVTMDGKSPVLCTREGQAETHWIMGRFLVSLARCCPALESVALGAIGREAQWGITDRQHPEYTESTRGLVDIPPVPTLREFTWLAGEGVQVTNIFHNLAADLLEAHAPKLESVRWAFTTAQGSGNVFLKRLAEMVRLRSLSLHFTHNSFIEIYGMCMTSPSAKDVASEIEKWGAPALREVAMRWSVITDDCWEQVRLLRALHCASGLSRVGVTFGVPLVAAGPAAVAAGRNPDGGELQCWYYDEAKMTEFLSSLPPSIETLVVKFDGVHDILDCFETYEFRQQHDNPLPEWSEEYRAQVRELVSQRKSIPKALLFDRLPSLREVHISGYNLVD